MEIMSRKRVALKIVAGVIFAVAVLVCFFFWAKYIHYVKAYHIEPVTEEKLTSVGAGYCKKLMIVAHPDDESLWGGAHLSEGGYLVVCLTNGSNRVRAKEFTDVVEKSGNTPIILDYPDKVFGERDDWENVRDKLENDLEFIMNFNDWELIVTHNPDGEYGHIHHVMTSESVTKLYNKQKPDAKLYYFGKYYKAVDLPNVEKDLPRISDSELEAKKKLCDKYESQKTTVEKLSHMLPYENWTEYKAA